MDERENYFEWLLAFVGVEGPQRTLYVLSRLQILWEKDFYDLVGNDADRGIKGQELRNIYAKDQTNDPNEIEEIEEALSGPCTVLEMMIGLAQSMTNATYRWLETTTPERWFWEMFTNLTLTETDTSRDFADVVDRMLAREYDADGYGSLFPLENPPEDMRRVEIWVQANRYLIENYMHN